MKGDTGLPVKKFPGGQFFLESGMEKDLEKVSITLAMSEKILAVNP